MRLSGFGWKRWIFFFFVVIAWLCADLDPYCSRRRSDRPVHLTTPNCFSTARRARSARSYCIAVVVCTVPGTVLLLYKYSTGTVPGTVTVLYSSITLPVQKYVPACTGRPYFERSKRSPPRKLDAYSNRPWPTALVLSMTYVPYRYYDWLQHRFRKTPSLALRVRYS